mmetsp:Transcript_38067/g.96241  ORF Transcript_38067/g.96241 Transcript_38067/m.96241 type:complete len:512 (+) Transcript_38067:913-2448(+)
MRILSLSFSHKHLTHATPSLSCLTLFSHCCIWYSLACNMNPHINPYTSYHSLFLLDQPDEHTWQQLLEQQLISYSPAAKLHIPLSLPPSSPAATDRSHVRRCGVRRHGQQHILTALHALEVLLSRQHALVLAQRGQQQLLGGFIKGHAGHKAGGCIHARGGSRQLLRHGLERSARGGRRRHEGRAAGAVGQDAAVVNVLAIGCLVLGHRHEQRGAVLQLKHGLDAALAVSRALAHDHCAPAVAQRARQDLGGRRRVAVHQHHERVVRQGGRARLGRLQLVVVPARRDREHGRLAVQPQRSHLDARIHQPARVGTQIEDVAVGARRLQPRQRVLHVGGRVVGELRQPHVPHLAVRRVEHGGVHGGDGHRLALHVNLAELHSGQRLGAARDARDAVGAARELDVHRGAAAAAQVLGGHVAAPACRVLPVDGHHLVTRLDAGAVGGAATDGRQHAQVARLAGLVGDEQPHALQLAVRAHAELGVLVGLDAARVGVTQILEHVIDLAPGHLGLVR